MKANMKSIYLTVLALTTLVSSNSTQAQTITWTNTSSGNWSVAANWSPNTIPASNNTVIINQPGVTVTLNGTATSGAIQLGTNSGATVALELNNQTLTIYGPLTVNTSGSFTVDSGTFVGATNAVLNGTIGWTSGYIEGILTLNSNSTLNLLGPGALNLDGAYFTNNGTVTWTNGTLQTGAGAVIVNNGLWIMLSDQTVADTFGGSGAVFNNYGIVRKSGGAGEFVGASLFQGGVVFNQLAGEIDAQNGSGTNGTEIAFQGGGTFSGGYITTNQYGLTVLSQNDFTLSGTVTGTNTWEDAGKLVGNNTINGALTWVGGDWNGASSVTVASNAKLLIDGTGAMNMDGTQVTNNGIVEWNSGTIQAGNGSLLVNNGLWSMTSDQVMNDAYGGVGAVFANYGTVRKSGGAGELVGASLFQSGVVFNQLAGEIDAQNGSGTNGTEIAFQGGGTFSGGYITTNQYGLTVLSAGGFTLDGTVSGTNTWEDSGNLVGANTITGALTWVGGTWNGASSVTINPGATLLIAGGTGVMDMDATQVTNNGTVVWSSGTIQGGNGSVVDNYGLWNMTSDQTFNDAYGGVAAVFNNYGTLRKSGGISELTNATVFQSVVMNQISGEIDVQNGTNGLQLAFTGGGNFTGGFITTNQFGLTTLETSYYTINGTVTGSNTWETANGGLTGNNAINGGLTWIGGNWNNAASVTITTNSTLFIAGGGGVMNMSACQVTNKGTIAWLSGLIQGGNGTVIANYGLWNLQSDQELNDAYGGAGTTFDNYGTFLKTGGASTNETLISGCTFDQVSGVMNVQTGNLVFEGTENFTGGSTTSSGTIALASGNFTINGATTTSNVVENSAGMVGANTINGALTWSGGNWNSATSVTIATNSTIWGAGGTGNLDMNGCLVTNLGTFEWISGSVRGGNASVIYNYGLWDMQSDQTLNSAYGGTQAAFDNYGILRKSGGQSELTNATVISMTINQMAGFIDVQNGTNGLQISFQGGGNFSGGYITTNSLGLTVLGASSFNLSGAITGSNTWLAGSGSLSGNNLINGGLTWVAGTWNTASSVMIATNSTLYVAGGVNNNDMQSCQVTNNGTVAWASGTLRGGSGTFIQNNGLWNSQSDQTFNDAFGGAGTYFDNAGIFRKTGGTAAGTIIANGVSFTNTGTLDAQVGLISLQGAYDLTNGDLNFGLNSLTNFGQISLTGAALLTGKASANLNGGYIPVEGNSFAVLSFGSEAGAFTSTNLPFADAWATNYTTTNFVLQVLNSRPILATVTNRSVNELTTLTVTNTATDLDQPPQTLTFSLITGPSGMTINSSTGVLTWTPAQTNSPSTNTVSVVVTDNGAPALSATNTFLVYVIEVNQKPTLPVVGSQTVNVLATLTVTNTATESNIHATNTGYQLIGAPSGAAISTNGIITWTPTQSEGPATNTFTTVVTNTDSYDLVNPHLTATNSFQVIVYAPSLSAIGNYTVNPGQTVSFTAAGRDNDSTRTLTYSLGTAPAGATINSGTGVFSWRPAITNANSVNTVQVKLTANSTPSDTVTQSFTITVNQLTAVTLQAIQKTATNFVLQVSGPQGPDYILETEKALKGQTWTPILTNTPGATPFDITTTNVNPTNQFYRIKLGP